jgi:hypothetical protein
LAGRTYLKAGVATISLRHPQTLSNSLKWVIINALKPDGNSERSGQYYINGLLSLWERVGVRAD